MAVRTGRASVDVVADVDGFAAAFSKDLDDALNNVKVDGKKVSEQLVKATDKAGKEAGEALVVGIDGKLRDASGRFVATGKQAGQGYGKGLNAGLEKTGELSRQLAILAARFTLAASAAAAMAPGILHLTAAVIPATGAVVALPAALLAVKAVSGTVSIATAGVGEAIEKGLTGTAEQAKEALKELPPAARGFAKSIIELKPELAAIRKSVSGRFFRPFQDDVGKTADLYLPRLKRGLSDLAGPLGGIAEQLAETGRKSQVYGSVSDLLYSTADAAVAARFGIDPLVTGLADLVSVTAPNLPVMAEGFATLATRTGQWLSAASQSGRIQEIWDNSITTLSDLGGIVYNVGSIFGAVWSAATVQGGSLLGNLRELTAEAAAFVQSAQGAGTLSGVFATLGQIGAALRTSLGAVLPALADSFDQLLPVVATLAPALADLIVAAAPLLPLFAQIVAVVAGPLTAGIAALTGWLNQHQAALRTTAVTVAAVYAALKLYDLYVRAAAVATTVWTLAQKAAAIATTAWAAANRILSISLLGTPLGLIIGLVAALVAGFVLAYQKSETFRNIVHGALNAVGQAAMWLWNSALKPAFDGIATAAVWLWNNALRPAFDGIVAAVKFVGTAISWLWTNIVQPYFQMIGTVALWLWTTIIQPAWNQIVTATRILGNIFAWLYSVFGPPVQAVGALVFWLWKQVFLVAWAGIRESFQTLAAVVKWWWSTILSPVFQAVAAAAKWLWATVIVPSFNGIKAAFMIVATVARNVWVAYISPMIKNFQNGVRILYNSYVQPIFSAIRAHIVGRIQSAVAVLGSIKSFVSNASASFTNLVNAIRSRMDAAASAVRGLPGRIRSAIGNLGSLLYSAGRNVIQGLINGITSKLGALRDKAASAASTIRNLFPFSPAKEGPLSGRGSPDIAGGKIAEMVAQGMERNTPRLYEAARAMASATMGGRGAGLDFAGQGIMRSALGPRGTAAVTPPASGGTTIVFSDGAIRITFQGSNPPSEAEAYRTGQAVAAGIASTLTSRAVHNTVRTL